MSVWSGAGIPVIGGQQLSGAQMMVLKGSRYLVEHPVVGLEGGIVENLGKPQATVEIHGIVYESGADVFLATLSGFIGSYNEIHVTSSSSGYYFIASGTGVMFEHLKFIYDGGHGYPFYHYLLAGVLSGEVSLLNITQSGGITYVQLNQINAQVYNITWTQPNMVNAQIYGGGTYVQPNRANSQIYLSYVLISGVSGY